MILKCLGSSSAGNCYLLESETECLVLETGIKFSEVKKALDFNIDKIVGVLVTHEHLDHSRYAKDYIKAGITVGMSKGTMDALDLDSMVLRSGYWYTFGGFRVTSFRVEHDCEEPFGFLIEHPEMGKLLFATDTAFVKYNFKKQQLNHILIETNYSAKIVNDYLEKGTIDQARVNRTLKTHMALETTKEFIKANRTGSLDSVLLLHLSDGNSNAEQFKREIQEVVGNTVKVNVADKNVTINLDLFPF